MNILLKFQLPSSYGLGVMFFLGFEEKGNSVNNDVGACRTAPATLGLLII